MAVEITNSLGQIDLNMIRDEDVAVLNDEQKEALSILVDTVTTRKAAEERKLAATKRVRAAMIAETEAQAACEAANPPPSFQDTRKAAIAAYNRSH
jgi:hypothetical protein